MDEAVREEKAEEEWEREKREREVRDEEKTRRNREKRNKKKGKGGKEGVGGAVAGAGGAGGKVKARVDRVGVEDRGGTGEGQGSDGVEEVEEQVQEELGVIIHDDD